MFSWNLWHPTHLHILQWASLSSSCQIVTSRLEVLVLSAWCSCSCCVGHNFSAHSTFSGREQSESCWHFEPAGGSTCNIWRRDSFRWILVGVTSSDVSTIVGVNISLSHHMRDMFAAGLDHNYSVRWIFSSLHLPHGGSCFFRGWPWARWRCTSCCSCFHPKSLRHHFHQSRVLLHVIILLRLFIFFHHHRTDFGRGRLHYQTPLPWHWSPFLFCCDSLSFSWYLLRIR